MGKLRILVCLLALGTPVLADEYFYDNGVYVGLGVNANRISRQKTIDFGSNVTSIGSKSFRTKISDWAYSPSLGIGYKFDENNLVSARGDWADYSKRQARNSTTTSFAFVPVDGRSGFGLSAPAASSIKTEWESNAVNLEFEYKRKLWSDPLGGVMGLAGLKYRNEGQQFTAIHGPNLPVSLDEKLRENLYGPYLGLIVAFKPLEEASLAISFNSRFGYFFKSAQLLARDVFGTVHRVNDHSDNGTFFTTLGLDLTYAITRNWSVSSIYDFNFINKSAHIFNNTAFGTGFRIPTRIEDSSVYTHNLGLRINYRF